MIKSFFSAITSATPLILCISVVVYFVHHAGWLDSFELLGLDFMLRLRQPIDSKYVFVVDINDNDYQAIFGKKFPLDFADLHNLLEKIASLKPRVIGVDLNTSEINGLNAVSDTMIENVTIVWGQNARKIEKHEGYFFKPIPVLGSIEPQPYCDFLGLAVMPLEADGKIRRYARKVTAAHRQVNTLPWAVIKQYCLSVFNDSRVNDELLEQCEQLFNSDTNTSDNTQRILPFSRSVNTLSASEILEADMRGTWKNTQSPVSGNIVILGGSHSLQDMHRTPAGAMVGAQLVAKAIESELQGQVITGLEEKMMVLVEILGGYLLVSIHFIAGRTNSPWIIKIIIPVIALGSSYSVFFSFDHWANFIPVLLGVLIHETHGHNRRHKSQIAPLKNASNA